jgi:hypothetical protein
LGTPKSQKAWNDLTRKLAHITATRQAQLAAKYSDTVVRGYFHTVREYMGISISPALPKHFRYDMEFNFCISH